MIPVPENHITVAEYLRLLNAELKEKDARIIGEVCNLKLYEGRSYLYFSVKDQENEGLLNCFMWKQDYELCGIELEDGLEVIIFGYPKVYEPNGSLSFQTATVELVGEGALKKAYEKLKSKLEKEGLFAIEKKRQIPDYPQKIGIITSKDGAVLADFTSNIGKFGYQLKFVNSRVEGQVAISDLMASIKTLEKQDIDVLVIMRGGGSLESFMAFNNEALVRAIANFPVPVIAGIGHDKDICLVSLVADKMVSTPTAVTQILNQSWERLLAKVNIFERDIVGDYMQMLSQIKLEFERSSNIISASFSRIFDEFKDMENSIRSGFARIDQMISEMKTRWSQFSNLIISGFERVFTHTSHSLIMMEKDIQSFNPERLLNRGYSIVRSHGKIISKVSELQTAQALDIKMSDGAVEAEIRKITLQ